jgi:hypothetical protein
MHSTQEETDAMKRRLAGVAFAVAAAATTLALGAGSALADTTVTLTYPVTGSTYLKAPNATVDLGPGTLTGTVDLNTQTLTGSLTLPPATGSFTELGLIPVAATTEFIQQGQTTGTINPQGGAITATSYVTIRITSLTVAGIPVAPGPACQTIVPAEITVTSQAGWSPGAGGTVTGTYTIPPFNNCGLLNVETPVINATLPGPGNTITLDLGKPTLGG